jgi:hypothetical protein
MMTTASIATPSSGTSIAAMARPAAATGGLPQLCMARPANSITSKTITERWHIGRSPSIEKIR